MATVRLKKRQVRRKRTCPGGKAGLVDLKILRRAIMVGVIFELVLVAMGHYRPRFRPPSSCSAAC